MYELNGDPLVKITQNNLEEPIWSCIKSTWKKLKSLKTNLQYNVLWFYKKCKHFCLSKIVQRNVSIKTIEGIVRNLDKHKIFLKLSFWLRKRRTYKFTQCILEKVFLSLKISETFVYWNSFKWKSKCAKHRNVILTKNYIAIGPSTGLINDYSANKEWVLKSRRFKNG